MDGDIAPLPAILELCERFDAWLLVDDAHGFGVLGAEGRGVLEHFGIASPRIIYVGTLGRRQACRGRSLRARPPWWKPCCSARAAISTQQPARRFLPPQSRQA